MAEWRTVTPLLPVGEHVFTLHGSGDADLYVRSVEAPTERLWDCRPFAGDSQETCSITLSAPAVVHVLVRGSAPQSDFVLSAH